MAECGLLAKGHRIGVYDADMSNPDKVTTMVRLADVNRPS